MADLTETMRELSRATDPRQAFNLFMVTMSLRFRPQGYVEVATGGLAPGQFRMTSPASGTTDPRILSGGFIGETVRRDRPFRSPHLDVRSDAAVDDALAGYGSVMATPIYEYGEATRWAFLFAKRADAFSDGHLEEFVLRANLLGLTLENIRKRNRLETADRKSQDEMDRIAAIQRALIPQTPPEIPGAEIAVSYETCERAGGDMYAIQPPPAPPVQAEAKAPEWGIVVADASGHGPAAAVMMAVMDSLLSVCPNRIEGPAAILTFLNEHLSLRDIEHSFITALVASWNPESRRLTFASAGHPPALLRRFGGSVERLLGGLSLPLGILPDVGYEEEHADLAAGESLVFYTDGISEARDPRGRPFLISGMEEILPRCGGSARDTRDAILRAVRRHQRRGICEDDRTLLVMKTLPGDN